MEHWKDLEQDPIKGVIWGIVIFLVGLILVWPLPALVLNSTEVVTSESIESAHQAILAAKETETSQARWFLPSYMQLSNGQELSMLLTMANGMLEGKDGAREKMSSCGGWVSEKIACLQDAKQQADSAMKIVWTVSQKLTDNAAKRQQARDGLKSFSTNQISLQLQNANGSFEDEGQHHLLKYTDPVKAQLNDATGKLKAVGDHIFQATARMPEDSNTQKAGDPLAALDEINHAKVLIDEINTLTQQVTSTLGELKTARTEIQPTLNQAQKAILLAEQTLTSINSQYGWGFELALGPSAQSLSEARSWLDKSQTTLTILVQPEGKYDWKLAYRQAQNSLKAAQSAKTEAEAQVGYHQGALEKIDQYNDAFTSANTAIGNGTSAESTLRAYHATDTWSSVVNNLTNAKSKLNDASSQIAKAQSYLALSVQRFAEAEAIAGTTLDQINQAQKEAEAVTQLATSLESYRSNWPGLERSADSTIDDEEPGPGSEYCAYDWAAKSDLSDAKNYLNQARSAAKSNRFESACSLATKAKNTASGVNSRCVNAYNSEMTQRTQVAYEATQAEESRIRSATQAAELIESMTKDDDDSSINIGGGSGIDLDDGGWGDNNTSPSYDDGGGWSDPSPSYDDGGGW